jgi:hypothetical protein
MDNPIGPIDYGTTNMFVKQTVKRAREAQSFGLMPYQRVILVLADRVEALEQIIAGRAAPETGRDAPSPTSGQSNSLAGLSDTLSHITNMAQRIAVLAVGCADKDVADLTEQEQIALAIIGGCAWERTDAGIRVTDAFGIQKLDGKFIVARRPL